MVLVLAIPFVASRIPFDDQPELITYARIGYIGSQLLTIGIFYLCTLKINNANDQTILKYVEPKSPMSQEPGELVTTTHKDYDLMEIQKAVRFTILGMMFVSGLHMYFSNNPQPLLIQGILTLKGALESPEVKLWVLNKRAVGDLKRPFKSGPGLFGMQAAQGPQTDKASIKEAEEAITKKDS